MNMMRQELQDAAIGVGITQSPENLDVLKKPGCAAAIWQRQPTPTFQTWIDELDPGVLPSARLILRPQEVRTALSDLFDAAQTPEGPHRKHLIEDIGTLTRVFCKIMDPPFVRLRLERITSNACRRFHIDAVTARLICTYRGTGTQYGISTDGEEPQRVFTVPAAAPILLRGTLWSEEPRSGLLHRSPPIEGTGETRYVLIVNPVFDPEDEI